MVTDIALLPANYDMWSITGVQTEPFPEKLHNPYTSLVWEAIHKNGGGCDYLSENILQSSTVKKGRLCYGPKEYGCLFLVGIEGISLESLSKIQEFVAGGGRVFCIGNYPCKSLGLKDYEKRNAEVKALVEKLKSFPDRFVLLEKPEDGKYLEWYHGIMDKYCLPHSVTVTNPDRFLLQNHYLTDDKSDMFLLVNAHMSEARETDLVFPSSVYSGKTAWLYDADTGERFRLKLDKGRIHVKLGASQTWLIVFNRDKGGDYRREIPSEGPGMHKLDGWKLTLTQPQLGWTKETEMDELKDLKDTEEYKDFMGTVVYRTSFNLRPFEKPQYLNLGKVCDVCELTVNGQSCGVRWFGDRIYDVSSLLHEGENTIEIKVTTLTGNYIQTLKDSKVAYRFIHRRQQPYVSAGLIGPVTLYSAWE